MLKKFSKLLLVLLLIFTLAANISICFADNEDDIATISDTSESNPVETSETTEDNVEEKDTTHYGDLYLFDNNVVIDNIVYGNVYVMANTVEITGQIEGNLFVLTNSLKLDSSVSKGGIVGGSIYVCADNIYYNGACTYLYAVCNNLEMTYNSYVVRDVKALSTNTILKAAVGRDVDLNSKSIDLGSNEDTPVIYRNFRYTSPQSVTIPENVMSDSGSVIYTNEADQNNSTMETVKNIIIECAIYIVTSISIFIIAKKITPNLLEKTKAQKFSAVNLLKAFGIGICSVIIVILFCILLLMTTIGIKLSFILALIFIVLCLVSVPIFTITITNKLTEKFKLDKPVKFYIALCLINIVLYLATIIPYVGWLFSLLITSTSIGLLVSLIIPHKKIAKEESLEAIETDENTEIAETSTEQIDEMEKESNTKEEIEENKENDK